MIIDRLIDLSRSIEKQTNRSFKYLRVYHRFFALQRLLKYIYNIIIGVYSSVNS